MKIAYHFTRRSIARLTGRETERMIEPLEMYAHVPVLFKGYAQSLPAGSHHGPFGIGGPHQNFRWPSIVDSLGV